MPDFLTRLVERTFGKAPVAQPLINPVFAPRRKELDWLVNDVSLNSGYPDNRHSIQINTSHEDASFFPRNTTVSRPITSLDNTAETEILISGDKDIKQPIQVQSSSAGSFGDEPLEPVQTEKREEYTNVTSVSKKLSDRIKTQHNNPYSELKLSGDETQPGDNSHRNLIKAEELPPAFGRDREEASIPLSKKWLQEKNPNINNSPQQLEDVISDEMIELKNSTISIPESGPAVKKENIEAAGHPGDMKKVLPHRLNDQARVFKSISKTARIGDSTGRSKDKISGTSILPVDNSEDQIHLDSGWSASPQHESSTTLQKSTLYTTDLSTSKTMTDGSPDMKRSISPSVTGPPRKIDDIPVDIPNILPVSQQAVPAIKVTIGRIEVRAMTSPAASRPSPIRQSPILSLEDYLKQHNR